MTDFGLTPTGLEAKNLRDVLDEIETIQKLEVSAGLDVSPSSPDGQRNAVTARQEALLWELMLELYDTRDPDKAEDDALVSLCKLTGTKPQAATFGTMLALCLLEDGETIQEGVHFAQVPTRSELWTPDTDYTAPSAGLFPVLFRCTVAGAVPAFATTLTKINAGPAGWLSVTNGVDADQGEPADTNETLRARRKRDLAKAGSATTRAIASDILALKDENGVLLVQSCTVLENDTSTTNLDGVPPHSIEVVVSDTPAVADTIIAAAIMGTKAAGIGKSGNTLSSYTDIFGNEHPVRFSRPVEVPIYLAVTLQVSAGFDELEFKAALVSALTASHGTGADVLVWEVTTAADLPGVLNMPAPPLLGIVFAAISADVVVAARSRATFDTGRVTVTVVP